MRSHMKICGCKKTIFLTLNFNRKRDKNMAKNSKQTSKSVASKASKILRDRRYGKNSKSAAGNALAQTKPGKKK